MGGSEILVYAIKFFVFGWSFPSVLLIAEVYPGWLWSARSPAFSVPSGQFRLQFPDAGLGRHAGFPLVPDQVKEVRVPYDVLPGLRVMPAQFPVFPPDVEVEHGAVALQDSFLDGLDGNWFILADTFSLTNAICVVADASLREIAQDGRICQSPKENPTGAIYIPVHPHAVGTGHYPAAAQVRDDFAVPATASCWCRLR